MKLLGNIDELKNAVVVSRWEIVQGVGFTILNKNGIDLPIGLFRPMGMIKFTFEDLVKLVYSNAEKMDYLKNGTIFIYFKFDANKYVYQVYYKDAEFDRTAYNFLYALIKEVSTNGGYLMRGKV